MHRPLLVFPGGSRAAVRENQKLETGLAAYGRERKMDTGADRGNQDAASVHRSCPPSAEYYKTCRTALKDPACPGRAFFEEINIDPRTAVQAGLGFDPDWVGFPYPEPGPAVIIPLRSQDYQAFRLHSDRNPWGIWGMERAWNLGLMFTEGLHFITSGVFDALAIRECGWDACALLGASNDNRFLMELGERDWTPEANSAYIIAFGKNKIDKSGAERLQAELKERGASVYIANLNGDARRVFEAHRDDPERFAEETEKAVHEAVNALREEGFDVPDAWLEKRNSFSKPSLRLPGKRLHRAEEQETEHQHLKRCQKFLWEADADVQRRFEKSGIRFETGLQAGFGMDPEKSGAGEDDPLCIVVPLPRKQYMQLDWGEDTETPVLPEGERVWPKQRFLDQGVIYITRDIADALVARENGQQTVCLLSDAEDVVEWLDSSGWPISRKAVFVIALGSSEEDQKNADILLTAFKANKRTATRAAIRGESASLQEEYRRDPETVGKRFAVATKKCESVIAARKEAGAKRRAPKQKKGAKPYRKKRPGAR